MLRRRFGVSLFLTLVVASIFLFVTNKYPEANLFVKKIFGMAPCQKPITYSIQNIDKRFGLSEQDVLNIVKEAEKIWEVPIKKELFQYTKNGKLGINFIYDYRQEATEKMKNLGIEIDSTKSSYDKIKSEFQTRKTKYDVDLNYLNSITKEFQTRKQKYESDVSFWNKKGGAPENIYQSLNNDRDYLKSKLEIINILQENLNKELAELNTIIDMMNSVARQINSGVKIYNNIGESTGREFSEGIYESNQNGEFIKIYQFENKQQLIRVMAHELGHALQMKHLADPSDIMFEINQKTNLEASKNDILELKLVCNLK